MPDPLSFAIAAGRLRSGFASRASLCTPFVDALPVSRAAISILGDPFGIETVCASDREAERLDELQIDLGEGPGWDALASRRPVIETELHGPAPTPWPLLGEAIRDASTHGVFAFPMTVGSLRIGAVDLYRDTVGSLTLRQIDAASFLSRIAATQVLRRAMADLADHDGPIRGGGRFRREVHQAVGMVSAQLDVTVDDALAVIRGHAYAVARPVREIAADLVAGRVDFSEER